MRATAQGWIESLFFVGAEHAISSIGWGHSDISQSGAEENEGQALAAPPNVSKCQLATLLLRNQYFRLPPRRVIFAVAGLGKDAALTVSVVFQVFGEVTGRFLSLIVRSLFLSVMQLLFLLI